MPRAVAESQHQLVAGVVASLSATINQGASDLQVAAAAPAPTAEELLLRLPKLRQWHGAVVMDGRTRALLASTGEQVPVEVLPPAIVDVAVAPVSVADGFLRTVTAIALPDNRLLAATSRVALPKVEAHSELRQALTFTTASGQVVASGRDEPDHTVRSLVAHAGAAAARGEHGTLYGASGPEHAVVTYAPVRSTELDSLVLGAVGIAHAAASPTTGFDGALPAALLVVVAISGFVLINRTLVAPLKRVRHDAIRVADGDLDTRVSTPRAAELRRVADAVEHCRVTMKATLVRPGTAVRRGRRRGPRARKRGMSAGFAVLLASLAVVAWAAGCVLVIGDRAVAVPQSVAASLHNQTAMAATAVQRSFTSGLTDLKAAVTVAAVPEAALKELHATQERYRSVYLVDETGRPGYRVGREPLRTQTVPPAFEGVRQDESRGRVAVLYAHVPLPGGGAAIGEFDVDRVADLLRRAPGEVRLLDAEMHTLVATGGYVAFEKVTVARVRRGVTEARDKDAVVRVVDDTAVVTATTLRQGALGRLAWSFVAEKPVADLALTGNTVRDRTLVVALIALLLGLLLLGWHHFLVIRPLRALAGQADRLVAGDRSTVLFSRRHDEIGTITSCLEICRQGLVDGVGRLGDVRRPAGNASEETTLFQRIEDDLGKTTLFERIEGDLDLDKTVQFQRCETRVGLR
ncbi:HAMP domain-containing protein [Allokutzneria sp. A3M-2-11 16]|uniref:HAMP domain-containing protein n=1 Tax=Allokutzneria sp. A3M-2-11 16 TaxID=2962043 RepID=UPI0020B6FF00|nr:HAMP domain-containing protein [Allokutzneria sp. A3M-2-11 16]MCP3802032.1 HAMP domain-containing protein [Allokutzneria sp. A3M-2-11 16]